MRETLMLGVCGGALVGALAWGCSGSTATPDSGTGPVDAAQDTTVQTDASDASTPPKDAPPPCVNDANLNTYNPPDASVPDSSLNMGVCLGCLRTHCKSVIDSCQAICECRAAVTGTLDCIAKGEPIAACATTLGGAGPETLAIGGSLLQCIQKDCTQECPLTGLPIPDAAPPKEAGVKDAAPPKVDSAVVVDASND